jgi:predicted house-cleaning noncanonical NTP pyrophosphatase (MazG superfamily)
MPKKYFKCDKLVRDKVISILESQNIEIFQKTIDREEYIFALKKKLVEEAQEILEANSRDELLEEMSDVMEVMNYLSSSLEIPFEEIEAARIEKKSRGGGFNNMMYIEKIGIDENNPAIERYLKKPEQYPEINSEIK